MMVASSSDAPAPSMAYHGGVGSRAPFERSSPSTGVLISALTHDKSMDFVQVRVLLQQLDPHLNNYSSVRVRTASIMRTMGGSRTGGWSLPCVMSD
jgi:hypothetical protein